MPPVRTARLALSVGLPLIARCSAVSLTRTAGPARHAAGRIPIPEKGASEGDEVIELEDGGGQVPSWSHLLAMPKRCHDAVEGEWCHTAIAWLKAKGLEKHPEWYPELSPESSSSEIQALLNMKGKSDCQVPCEEQPEPALKEPATQEETSEDCYDARPDSRCYTAVAYGLAEGLTMHPELYPGLSATASFRQVQESLYLQGRVGCERPCPGAPVRQQALQGEEELIEQSAAPTRVQDMSVGDLNRYLDGDWNGVPTTSFNVPDADRATSTFARVLHRSTTEPFVPTTGEPAEEPAAE